MAYELQCIDHRVGITPADAKEKKAKEAKKPRRLRKKKSTVTM